MKVALIVRMEFFFRIYETLIEDMRYVYRSIKNVPLYSLQYDTADIYI